jgi:hypothetical protein
MDHLGRAQRQFWQIDVGAADAHGGAARSLHDIRFVRLTGGFHGQAQVRPGRIEARGGGADHSLCGFEHGLRRAVNRHGVDGGAGVERFEEQQARRIGGEAEQLRLIVVCSRKRSRAAGGTGDEHDMILSGPARRIV